MKTSTIAKTLGVLALVGSSASMAATVTITASTLAPTIGSNFTMTITSDVANSYATTMALAFDASKVVYASGTFLAPFNFYSKVSANNATPTDFYVEAPTAQVGTYNVAVLTFTALAAGAANIVVNDENCAAGNNGWADVDGNCIAGINYVQAPVVVASAVPAPATLWLLGSGLVGLVMRSKRGTRAA